MRMGRTLGLVLAGGGLLAVSPSVARADDDASLKERLRQLEQQVTELKGQFDRRVEEPLSDQVDRHLQEQEKGVLWVDRNGKALGKAVDSVWVTAWLRGRPTWSDNTFDLNDDTDDEGFATFFRGGLGIGANLKGKVSMFIGLDFAGTWGNTTTLYGNDTPTATTVQEAYIDGLYSKHLNLDTRIGRFEMQYGDEYVIGRTEFAQASTYFDGVKVGRNVEGSGLTWDLFGAKLVDGFKNPLTPTPDDSAYMAGVYANYYAFENKTRLPGGLEPYYIVVWDAQEAPGAVPAVADPKDTHTAGFRWYGEKATKDRSGIGWNINANAQYNSQWKWSTDSRLTYTNPNMKGKPMVFGQFAYASGDVDGVTGYNPLWQDGHGRFGWADQFAFTNLALAGVGMHMHPREGLTYGLEGRSIHQARSTRALSSRQLAWEIDFVVMHKYSDNVAVEFAYSYIYWRDARNAAGDRADDAQRAYLQVVVSF
jgi:hypothetical protein